jgi:hypothetical protein
VSCTSAAACTVIGTSNGGTMLAERWDGNTWRNQTLPTRSGALSSTVAEVSCSSAAACTAVGNSQLGEYTWRTLVERYSG